MKKIIILTLIMLLLRAAYAYADRIDSRFFSVEYEPPLDILSLYDALDGVSQSSVDTDYVSSGSVKDMFSGALDNLYYAVCDIMDIHLSGIKVRLVLVAHKKMVINKSKSIIGRIVDSPSFYHRQNDVIYLSVPDFSAGILGHELGHFIIDHYFVVPPPEKMQEVLCGYVEYTLLKQTGKSIPGK